MADPHAKLWHSDWDDRGTERGIKVLGTPLGHRADFEAQLQRTADDHQQLLDRIPLVRDLQSAWLLFVLRVNARELLPSRGPPFCFESFARLHDTRIWQCFSAFLGQLSHRPTWEVGSLPLCMRGLGLRSALRTAHAPHWASWADCLQVIKERRGVVVRTLVAASMTLQRTQSTMALGTTHINGRLWLMVSALAHRASGSFHHGMFDHGWQFSAASSTIWPRLSHRAGSLQVTVGTHVWAPFHCSSFLAYCSLLPPTLPRAALLSLVVFLLLFTRTCQCGRLLDFFGHHRAVWESWVSVGERSAVDTTLVSPVQANGHPPRRCAEEGWCRTTAGLPAETVDVS